MNKLLDNVWSAVQAEPVAAQWIVQTAIGTGCAFGLGWSGVQIAAVVSFSAAVLAFATRKVVTPLSKAP